MKLAIAIPTYNRADHLSDRLDELLPQLQKDVVICVYDNGSSDHTNKVIDSKKSSKIRYTRSEMNLGMAANISRCFTETKAEWMWMLGDDDAVSSDAISRCLSLILSSEAEIINTVNHACANSVETTISGLEDVLYHKNITDLMQISSNVYHLEKIKNSFKILAPASLTMAPHLAMIMHALHAQEARLKLSQVTLLNPKPTRKRYSSMELALGLTVMPLFVPKIFRKRVALSLYKSTRWMVMWSLVEVVTTDDADAWKKNCRYIDGVFYLHGVKYLDLISGSLSFREIIRNLLIIFLRNAPLKWICRYASNQQKRFSEICDTISFDLA
jgi:glycosyltransferase involved in cell wall biosynthesis